MADTLVRDQTPLEFFREQLVRAMEHQRVSTSAFTEYYLVNLLTACVQVGAFPAPEPGYDETPLALLYLQALKASRRERRRLLRAMGDSALFVSGFFADSLAGKLADLAYYKTMGGHAYLRLSHEEVVLQPGNGVFSELSRRFTEFADVLAEVSEGTRLSGNRSILALYERWLQTGSRRAAALLAERGLAPVAPGREGEGFRQ
jgi:hypothetical protein